MDNKIKITRITEGCFLQKGFDNGPFKGCFNAKCGEDQKGDACCRYGCDVDKESYDLMMINREIVEAAIGQPLSLAFKGRWFGTSKEEYLGGEAIRSRTRKEDGFCVFHSKNSKGCTLVKLVLDRGISKRIIPTICRIYPLAYHNNKLGTYDEILKVPIEKGCNCISEENKTTESLFIGQKNEIEDIFEIKLKDKKKKVKINSFNNNR